jgi:hypothetical protein
MYVCIYMRTYLVYVFECINIPACIYAYICIYIFIYIRTYSHIYDDYDYNTKFISDDFGILNEEVWSVFLTYIRTYYDTCMFMYYIHIPCMCIYMYNVQLMMYIR